jgi:hypothetical protein
VKKLLIAGLIANLTVWTFIAHEAAATTPFAGANNNSTEARVIQFHIWEDGSGSILRSNGTKLQFLHAFMDPHYLYENNTIIIRNANNGNEVFID